jgi:CRP-like cAMP-binding protein
MSQAFRQHLEKVITLTDAEFDYVFSKFSVKKLKKHQFLIQEGSTVLHDYWVVKGLLKAYHTYEDGKIHILQFAMEDWWISDYQSLVYQIPASINIDCIEDTELLVISVEDRELLCNEMKGMANFFRKKSHAGYVALQQRILFLLNKNPQERYTRFLKLNPKLLQRLPKTLLAAYIGVSRETLSRLSHP